MIKISSQIATTSIAGISLRATDVNTIAGVSTTETVSPSNLTAKIDTSTSLSGNLDTRIPSQKAVKTYADTKLAKASNLSDVGSAATAFNNIKQLATASYTGVMQFATYADVIAGTSSSVALNPANLADKLADPGIIGENIPAIRINVLALKVVTGAGLNKQLKSDALGNLSYFTPGTMGDRDLYDGVTDPTGGTGVNGDVYFKYI